MNEQAIRFRLGVFVLAALFVLAVMITLFGGQPTWFKKVKEFTVLFPNASGLAPGSPVKKSGVRIGEVRSVKLDDNTGAVAIGIAIDAEYNVAKSDRPTLMQNLLGGDSYIAFLPPEDPKLIDLTPVPLETVIKGTLPTDPGMVLQKTSDLLPGAQETLNEMKKVFTKIDKMAPVLESAIQDFGEVARATRDFIPKLEKTNEQLQNLAKSVNDSVPTAKKAIEEAEVALRYWGRVGERVNVLLQMNEEKLTKTLSSLEEATRRAAELLDPETQKAVREIVRNVKVGSDRLESLSRNSDELIQETRITVRTLNKTLGKADEFMTQMTKVTQPLAERGPTILKNVEEATVTLNKTLGDARELLQAIGRSEGTFNKFITDPALYNNLNDTALSAARIMPRIDRALRDFETFADKIARHPESLGLGGVVRPASGLKEAPSFWPPR